MGKYQLHKLLFPQLVLIFEIRNKGPKIWCLQKYIQGINQVGKFEQNVKIVDITWKTKRVRWNHVIIWMWELRNMTTDSWRQRCKLQMKQLRRRGQKKKKKKIDLPFSCAISSKKEKKKKQIQKKLIFTREAWCGVQKERVAKDGI